MADVWVRNKNTGEVGVIDDSELHEAADFAPMGNEELARYRQQQEIKDDPTTILEGAAVGAADVLTAGHATEMYIGDDEEKRKYVQDLVSARPLSRMAGQAAGLVPVGRAVGAIGRLAGLGRVGLPARLAAEEAAEGAIFGHQFESSQAKLEQRDVSGEDLAIAATKDAAIGALSGAIIGGVGSMFGKLPNTAVGRLARGTASDAFVDKMEALAMPGMRKIADKSGVDVRLKNKDGSVVPDRDLFGYFSGTDGAKRLEKVRRADAVREDLFTSGRKDIQEMLEAADYLEGRLSEPAKKQVIMDLVDDFKPEMRDSLVEWINTVRRDMTGGDASMPIEKLETLPDAWKKVLGELKKYHTEVPVKSKKMSKSLEGMVGSDGQPLPMVVDDVTEMQAKGALHAKYAEEAMAGEMFQHGDMLKKKLDRYIEGLESGKGEFANVPGSGELKEMLIHHRQELMRLLENDGVWGQAAQFQKRINDTRAGFIDPMKNFDRVFVKRLDDGNWGKRRRELNETAWRRFTSKDGPGTIGDPDSGTFKVYEEWVKKQRDHVKRIAQELPEPEVQAAADKFENALKRLEDKSGNAANHAMHEKRFAQLEEVQKRMGGVVEKLPIVGGMGVMGAGLMGGPGVGIAVYTARHLGKMVTRPVDTLHLFSGARGMAKSTDGVMDGAVATLKKGAAKAPDIAGFASKSLARRGVFLHHLAGGDYTQVVEALETSTQESIQQEVLGNLGPMAAAFPADAMEAVETAWRQSAYLKQFNPESYDPITGKRNMVSQTRQESFMLRVNAVRDPLQVIRSFQENRAMSEELHALQHVYPKTYQRLQSKVHGTIFEMGQDGMEMSYQSKIMSSMLLDSPVEPMLNAQYMQEVAGSTGLQEMKKPQQQQKKKGNRKYDFEWSEKYSTGSQSFEIEYQGD